MVQVKWSSAKQQKPRAWSKAKTVVEIRRGRGVCMNGESTIILVCIYGRSTGSFIVARNSCQHLDIKKELVSCWAGWFVFSNTGLPIRVWTETFVLSFSEWCGFGHFVSEDYIRRPSLALQICCDFCDLLSHKGHYLLIFEKSGNNLGNFHCLIQLSIRFGLWGRSLHFSPSPSFL